MSKILVLAEKPSVGRDIGKVLNCNKKNNSYLEGNKYIVTWALGHLVTLADPEEYNKKYKTWNLEDLPIIPKEPKLTVIKQTSKQYHIVKSLMHRKDVEEIIIATDAGREGELVARWIIEKANIRKRVKRLWISSVTDKAIKDGFNNLKDGKKYERLFDSAKARAEADWVVGINATRALTVKYNSQLSCGRVQTPTLKIIHDRVEEIQKFQPKEYFGIRANSKDLKFTWQDGNGNSRNFNEEAIDKTLNKIKDGDLQVIKVDKKDRKQYSKGLYDLTELQRDANRIFNFSPKETLSIMQNLYERHKVLTYPRTDSKYLTKDIVPTINDRLKSINIGPYKDIVTKIINKPVRANSSFVDDKKVTDHHAIIPTEQRLLLSELNNNEKRIYDLVVKRFLSVLYPAFEYEQTTISGKINGENFIAKGKRVLKEGWKAIYLDLDDEDGEDDIKDQTLPLIKNGDKLKIKSLEKTKDFTKPPSYFNEGTLLGAMENPGKYMEERNKELEKILDETGGIGTVATRADIIEKLYKTFLIENRGKDIHITSKGKQLLDLVPTGLQSPELTGTWEKKLSLIEEGKLDKDKFVQEMKNYSTDIVKDIKNSDKVYKHDNLTRTKCPECGKYMLEVNNKRGKMYVCQDRECGNRVNISQTTNARCPNCKKKLELRGQGQGQIFTCVCGHRERMSSFNERKKKQKNRLNKKDVSRYLKDQKRENEPINTDLADALSKLKF